MATKLADLFSLAVKHHQTVLRLDPLYALEERQGWLEDGDEAQKLALQRELGGLEDVAQRCWTRLDQAERGEFDRLLAAALEMVAAGPVRHIHGSDLLPRAGRLAASGSRVDLWVVWAIQVLTAPTR